jgi:hypothetical protein
VKYALSAFFTLKLESCGNSLWIMYGLQPKCNEWWNCKTMVQNVQRWVGEQMFTIKSEVVNWPSVMSDHLVQSVDQKICERRHLTISELPCEFPQISRTALCKIITVRLSYHKFCERWVPEILTGMHKMHRMASALTFLEWHHKVSDIFLNHIIQVTGNETWVLFVNVETKEQSQQLIQTHSPNKPKKFKQTSAKKLFFGVGKKWWWWNSCNKGLQ